MVWLHLLYSPSRYTWRRPPWDFCSLGWTIQLSKSLYIAHFLQVFSIFIVLSQTHYSTFMSLLHCRVQSWTQHTPVACPELNREGSHPPLAGDVMLFLVQLRRGFFDVEAHCSLIVVHQDIQDLLKAPSQPVCPPFCTSTCKCFSLGTFPFVHLKILIGSFLQDAKFLLKSSTIICCISQFCQFCVFCKHAEGTLFPSSRSLMKILSQIGCNFGPRGQP